MKKTISIITFLILIATFIFSGNVNATILEGEEVELDPEVDLNVETDKQIVRPGENVQVKVGFSENMGTYTVKIAYDDNIFEYVSVDGGTANDTKDKVNVVFHDETGGTNPRTNMSVTFKAKDNITTSNPTEFTITAEGLANADASEVYEDILTPIVKNVTVEPEYVNYKIELERMKDVLKDKENPMTISYSSSMGRYYEHARLVAEATTPAGATVKLLGTDEANLEHDIIQSGWGDAQGYKIGGKDVKQDLKVRAIFSEVGTYTITFNLIDRDDSDKAIASSTFSINVVDEVPATEPEVPTTPEQPEIPTTPEQPQTPTQTPETQVPATTNTEVQNVAKQPSKLPKTGSNIYVPVIVVIALLSGAYIYYNKKNRF